jgi:SNF2 family DNA or RNA helicase
VAPRNCVDGGFVSETYDILNCGPRQRFVVSGAKGPLIVHNCFGMYDGSGGAVDFDIGPRLKVLKEVIEECDEKVIVFVPYTGALNRFYDELKGTWTVEVVDGSVSASKRNRIFKDFQEGVNPRVILAHPGTMAHGLTLTAATTIVWAAPVTSTETFLQANARISRPGQTKVAHIVMLHGSKVERRLYQTLKDRRKLQDLVLELAKEGGKR